MRLACEPPFLVPARSIGARSAFRARAQSCRVPHRATRSSSSADTTRATRPKRGGAARPPPARQGSASQKLTPLNLDQLSRSPTGRVTIPPTSQTHGTPLTLARARLNASRARRRGRHPYASRLPRLHPSIVPRPQAQRLREVGEEVGRAVQQCADPGENARTTLW